MEATNSLCGAGLHLLDVHEYTAVGVQFSKTLQKKLPIHLITKCVVGCKSINCHSKEETRFLKQDEDIRTVVVGWLSALCSVELAT